MGKLKNYFLGEICTTTQGIQLPKSVQIQKEKKGYKRYLYISDFTGSNKHQIYVLDEYSNKEVFEGDLIMANTSNTSAQIFWGQDGILSNNLFKIEPDKSLVNKEFLYHYFKSNLFWNYVNFHLKQAAQPHLGHKIFKNHELKIPPLPEQQRIVAKLDGLFAKIDQAIGLLEENIAHTKALMGSVLDEIFSDGDVMLKDACIVGPKKSEVRDLDEDLEVSFLPMKDLNEHDINFKPNEIKRKNEVYKGYTYFADGDVILAKVTPCFENGKAGLAKNLLNGIGFGSSEYHVLRPKKNVLAEWIYFAVLTEQFRVTGKENMTGAGGLKRIPRPFLEQWKIPVPEISIQKKQIKRIVKIQEETKKLESSINEKLNDLKTLKSSLLDQAFKGAL